MAPINDDLIIRPMAKSDETDWRALWRGYLEYYESEVPDEIYVSTFARLLGDDPHDYNGLIAEMNGKPIGLTHYLFHRHAWKVESVCYLQDLYVAPDVRNSGAGAALINAVYAAADAAGAPAVYWMTQEFNAAARHLYDKVGQLTPFIKYSRP